MEWSPGDFSTSSPYALGGKEPVGVTTLLHQRLRLLTPSRACHHPSKVACGQQATLPFILWYGPLSFLLIAFWIFPPGTFFSEWEGMELISVFIFSSGFGS